MARQLKKRESENFISHERLYYRIGEVSRITGLKAQRLYRRKDLDIILKIKKLLYEEGFTIAGAKKKIRDMERLENKQMKLQPADKGSNGKAHEFLTDLQEELKGIRKMLE